MTKGHVRQNACVTRILDGATAAGLLAGAVIDAAVGDPRRGHPVAVFGSRAAALEKRIYRDSRLAGVAYTTICVGAATAAGLLAERVTRSSPIARAAVTAAATWAVLGGTTLGREGMLMARSLEEGDLAAARARLPHLCGRDPSGLDAAELARGTVESIAENTSDAVVAPLVWGAIFGVPGLLGYRAVNTLDAMVGHRSPRYARFGWASARLDDVANYVLSPADGPAHGGPGRSGGRLSPPRGRRVDQGRAPPPQPQLRTLRGGLRRLPSAYGSAGPTTTAAGSSTARSWATALARPSPTSPGPYGSRVRCRTPRWAWPSPHAWRSPHAWPVVQHSCSKDGRAWPGGRHACSKDGHAGRIGDERAHPVAGGRGRLQFRGRRDPGRRPGRARVTAARATTTRPE